MNPTAQQLPSNPALDFAQSVLDVTNNGLELIEILRDIAEDDENANTNDRITATNSLMDRTFGKPPKQLFPSPDPSSDSAPDTEDVCEIRESPPAASHEGPESARLVSQVNGALYESLGPAPTAPQTPGPFDPNSIHFTIQKHILDITNNGQTLRDTLLEIARAEDNPKVTSYHRRRAAGILVDRVLGTDSTPVLRAVQDPSEPGQSVPHNPEYPPGYVFDPTKDCIYCSQSIALPEGHEGEHLFDHEGLAKAFEEIQQMLDEQGITPDPNSPKIDWHISSPSPEWVANNIDVIREESAKFEEELKLRIERQKNWPKIEERRRKKLEQIYPSHSEDESDGPPET